MSELTSEYKNSCLIDYNRWSLHKEVDALVDLVSSGWGSRKYKDFKINMKLLILNLYQSHLVDPSQYVSYFGDKGRYRFIRRYNPNKIITHTYLTDAIKHLCATGYITHKRGGHFYDEIKHEYYGYTNKIRSTSQLVNLFREYKLTPEMITWFEDGAGLIIMKGLPYFKEYIDRKGKKKKRKIKDPVDYKETRATNDMLKVISSYNRLLDHTYIDIDSECISEEGRKEIRNAVATQSRNKSNLKLNLTRKRVYRVFNNNSFKNGGRFYGAWWMGCPGVLRKYIYINGLPTVEMDYSGIHIHLLYALRGINYAELNQDSYSIIENDPNRPLNKLLLLTAINAVDAKAAVNSTFKQLVDEGTHHKYNLGEKPKKKLHSILDLLKQKHLPISEDIASNKGIELQFYDSTIMEKLIKHYTKQRTPILTVHDSVVCQARIGKFVKDRMLKFYCDLLNEKLKLAIQFKSTYPQKDHVFQSNMNRYQLPDLSKLINYSPVIGYLDYKPLPIKLGDVMIPVDITNNPVRCSKKCNFHLRCGKYKVSSKSLHYTYIDISAL